VIQFAVWVGHFARGDWGTSIGTGEKVLDMFLRRLPITLELFIGATLWSVAIGIPAGIIGALKRNSATDVFVTAGAIVGVSIPAFWEAIVLIYLLAVLVPVFPPSGYVPFSEDPLLNLRAMVLPTFVLGTHSGGLLARYVRSSLLEVLGQDYIRTARAKGFSEAAVVVKHALKPGMIPVVTVIGLSWGGLLAGAFFIEVIFALPGLGRMSVEAIFQKDFPVIQATLVVVSLNVLLVNLLVDILYGYLDPRMRVRG
jgi:peptide/nickel transport system permease protein